MYHSARCIGGSRGEVRAKASESRRIRPNMSLADLLAATPSLSSYAAPLAALGYDDLTTVRGLGDNDFAGMCSSVNMLAGRSVTLRARLAALPADPAPGVAPGLHPGPEERPTRSA